MSKMNCHFCGTDDTRIVDSRPSEGNLAVRRRRHCPNCGARFTTYERRVSRNQVWEHENDQQ